MVCQADSIGRTDTLAEGWTIEALAQALAKQDDEFTVAALGGDESVLRIAMRDHGGDIRHDLRVSLISPHHARVVFRQAVSRAASPCLAPLRRG